MYPRLGYVGMVTQEEQYTGAGAEGSPENMPASPEPVSPTIATPGGAVPVSAPAIFDARDWAIRFAQNNAAVGPQIAALPSGQIDQVHTAFLDYMVGENHNDLSVMEQEWNQFVLGIQPPPPSAPPTCPAGSIWDPARQQCMAIPAPDGPGSFSPPQQVPAPASAPAPSASGGGGGSGDSTGIPDTGITTQTNDQRGATTDTAPDGTPIATAGFSGTTALVLGAGLLLAMFARGKRR